MHLYAYHPFPVNYYFHVGRFTLHVTRHLLRVLLATAVVSLLSFIIINSVLLSIQLNSLPLFSRVESVNLGLKSPAEARVLLQNYGNSAQLELAVEGKAYTPLAKSAGINPDVDAIIHSLKQPGGWNKLPLINLINNWHKPAKASYQINSQQLSQYLSTITLPTASPAVDARVVVPENIAQAAYIEPEKIGQAYTVENIAAQIKDAVVSDRKLSVELKPQSVEPKLTRAKLAGTVEQTNKVLNASFSLSNGSASYKFTAADLRKIVSVTVSDDGKSTAIVDKRKVVELLRAKSNLFYIAPSANKVSTLDGVVVSNKSGANGQGIDIDASAKAVAQALESGQSSQKAVMSTISASTTYLRNYTATSAGLSALIKDFVLSHGGNFKVVTFELTDNRSAAYDQNAAIVPASVYKVFLAYIALRKVDQGAYTMSTPTSAGTLDHCINRMIVVSDNTCASAVHDLIGWAEADAIIHADGFGSTRLNNSGGGYMSTTAADVANMMKALYNGQLIGAGSLDYLFGLMKQQIYRSGIPAGSSGSAVADKVGFLEGWNHDAAIVYAPKTTYVLVVMTTNSSFSTIKDLSSQIFNLYNQ